MCSICQDIPIAEYLPNSVINVYKYVYNYLTYLLVNQQINRLNMYKSLSSMFFYILCIHLCSTEELGAVPLSTRSTRWLILVQPQLSSYLFFLSNAFSDCGQNGFYLQAELFLFAIRKNSACSQKNFWLYRTEREAVNIKQEEQQEYHTRFCKISEVVWILSQICLKISFSVYLKSFLASFPSRFLQGQCQRAHVSLLTMHCECSLSSLEINRPLFLYVQNDSEEANRILLCADKPAVVATDANAPRRQLKPK